MREAGVGAGGLVGGEGVGGAALPSPVFGVLVVAVAVAGGVALAQSLEDVGLVGLRHCQSVVLPVV